MCTQPGTKVLVQIVVRVSSGQCLMLIIGYPIADTRGRRAGPKVPYVCGYSCHFCNGCLVETWEWANFWTWAWSFGLLWRCCLSWGFPWWFHRALSLVQTVTQDFDRICRIGKPCFHDILKLNIIWTCETVCSVSTCWMKLPKCSMMVLIPRSVIISGTFLSEHYLTVTILKGDRAILL